MNVLRRLGFAIMALFSVMSIMSLSFAQAPSTIISSSFCNIINNVRIVVGVISLVLFVLGGVLYAIAHLMPAAGNLRGNLQGWSLGMVVGGIIGLIIVIIAPGIISVIASSGGLGNGALTNC